MELEKAIMILENMQDVECEHCPNEEECYKNRTGLCIVAVNIARECIHKMQTLESYEKTGMTPEEIERMKHEYFDTVVERDRLKGANK